MHSVTKLSIDVRYGGGEVEAHHEKCSTRWYDGITIVDVFCAGSWEADWDNGVKAEDFSDKSCYVRYLFFGEAFFPRVAVGVDSHDLFISSLLDVLAIW